MNSNNYSAATAITTEEDFCIIGTPVPAILDLIIDTSDDCRGLHRVLLIAFDTKSRENYLKAIDRAVSAKLNRLLYKNISTDYDIPLEFQQHVILNPQDECIREIHSVVTKKGYVRHLFSDENPDNFTYNLIIVQNPEDRCTQIEDGIYQEAEYIDKEVDAFTYKNSEIKQWIKDTWSQAKFEETEDMSKYLDDILKVV